MKYLYVIKKGDLSFYLGMTRRNFGVRKDEHESDTTFGLKKCFI